VLDESIAAYRITLTDHVVRLLRQRMINFMPGYRPGERLNAQAIADELGISKTPVTTAIRLLAAENLVIVRPRSGTFVWEATDEELYEVFQVVAQLEAANMRLVLGKFPSTCLRRMERVIEAAERSHRAGDLEAYLKADAQFHHIIGSIAGNKMLHELHLTAHNQLFLAAALKSRTPGDADVAVQGHRELLGIFRQGDLSLSQEAAEAHWEESWERYLRARGNGWKSLVAAPAAAGRGGYDPCAGQAAPPGSMGVTAKWNVQGGLRPVGDGSNGSNGLGDPSSQILSQ
jgi:DNA-binding GntR family transcriptional regulator